MKIGVLTFHWAANHGAVLQTYATQKFLSDAMGQDVEIIHYIPKPLEYSIKNAIRPHLPKVIWQRMMLIFKDKKIQKFRNEKLNLTKRYFSNKELMCSPPDVDILICGSDQIWNPSYLRYGERGITPVYFLNFGKTACKRIALSVSFGCSEYPKELREIIAEHIKRFDAISVREKTGLTILRSIGENRGVLTADPTALLPSQAYAALCEGVERKPIDIGLCILRKQEKETKKFLKRYCINKSVKRMEMLSMERWLATIRDCELVITNSFHCTMLSLKLHTPFIVLTESGALAGMNDRLFTLLDRFGLSDRIFSREDPAEKMSELSPIHWDIVDQKMEEYAQTLREYLQENILH